MTTSLSGLGGIGTPGTVGNDTPEWDFPGGIDRLPDDIRSAFFRSDFGPTGFNEFLQKMKKDNPKLVDRFRTYVNAGLIKPKNAAATNIARSEGGLRAGDQSLLGPIIDGMPEGLTPEYWSVVIQKAQQAANEQIAIMQQTGYFEGKTTLERDRIEAQIKDNIANTEIKRRLADETIRKDDQDEAFRRDEQAQNMRQNIISQFGYDPGPMGAAGVAAGNKQAMIAGADGVPPAPGSQEFQALQQERTQAQSTGQAAPSDAAPGSAAAAGQQNTTQSAGADGAPGGAPEVAGQYGTVGAGGTRPNMTTQVGNDIGWQFVDGQWQQTIAGRTADTAQQNQAWQQQADVAKAASNPRDYIYAQMLGNARGGLAGQPPTNQMQQTTQSPYSWGGNQMPGTQMPGMPGATPGGMPGQRPVPAMPMPDGQEGIEPWMMGPDAANRKAAMMAGQMPGADGMASTSPFNPATGMRFDERTGQYTSAPMPTAEQNMQQRMDQFRQQQQGLPGQPTGADGMNHAFSEGPESLQGLPGGLQPNGGLVPMDPNNRGWAQGPAGLPGGMGMRQFQAPGQAGMGMWGMRQQPMAQPLQAGQPGQMGMPGAMPGGMPGMRMGQQPGGPGQPGNIAVGAFSNALNQNRLVPKTGGMGTQGSMQTMGQIGQTNPQKWRAQDFMRGNASEKQQALGTASAAGFSDDDTMSALGKNLPTFKAPGAGAMA